MENPALERMYLGFEIGTRVMWRDVDGVHYGKVIERKFDMFVTVQDLQGFNHHISPVDLNTV